MQWLFKARHWLAFGLIFLACFFALQKLTSYSLVRVNLSSSHTTSFKVYWTSDEDDQWTEGNSATMRLTHRKNHYILPLPVALPKIKRLRIDPNDREGIGTNIQELSLYHLSTKTINFGGAFNDDFSQFKANEQVAKLRISRGLRFTSSGEDPRLIIDLSQRNIQPQPWLIVVQALVISLLLLSLIMHSSSVFIKQLRWVPMAMLFAATAVATMATISDYNSHPDEFSHIGNARYYQDHYAPSEVCSDDARDTYTIYGVSRLDKREIAYFIGGRYLQLVDAIPARDHIKLRYLNVALFFFLVLLAFRQPKARILFLPLLLTPQAWYLFSYYNSDALSLFVVLITAYQVFVPRSLLRRLLIGERPPAYILWVLAMSLLFAMQFWLKLNYVFYVLFLMMLGTSWLLVKRRLPEIRYVLPLVLAFGLGTSLFLSWEISRHVVNDYELSAKVIDCRQQTAKRSYRPSTPLPETDRNYRLRDKGYSASDIITTFQWPRRIFYTGLGTYGYTEYLNSDPHFAIASLFIALLFLYAITMIAIKGDAVARMSVLSMLAALCGVTLAAFWANWSMDFQPQGRYLMVYLPLFGSLLAMYRDKLNLGVISVLASVPFLLAVYSFFAVALIEIPKH